MINKYKQNYVRYYYFIITIIFKVIINTLHINLAIYVIKLYNHYNAEY